MASLFKVPQPPKPPAPPTMADPEDAAARAARRSAMNDTLNRRGRDSTILGGGEYSSTKLGGRGAA